MPQSREDFIRAWKYHLAGLGMYGFVEEQKQSATERARRALELTTEVDKLLGQMYDGLGLPRPEAAQPSQTQNQAPPAGPRPSAPQPPRR